MPGFSNAAHLLVRGASHDDELWLGNQDIAVRISAFLAGHPVSDVEMEVPPPVFAKNKFELLTQTVGITPWAALAVIGVLAILLLSVLALLLKWRRRSRVHRDAEAH